MLVVTRRLINLSILFRKLSLQKNILNRSLTPDSWDVGTWAFKQQTKRNWNSFLYGLYRGLEEKFEKHVQLDFDNLIKLSSFKKLLPLPIQESGDSGGSYLLTKLTPEALELFMGVGTDAHVNIEFDPTKNEIKFIHKRFRLISSLRQSLSQPHSHQSNKSKTYQFQTNQGIVPVTLTFLVQLPNAPNESKSNMNQKYIPQVQLVIEVKPHPYIELNLKNIELKLNEKMEEFVFRISELYLRGPIQLKIPDPLLSKLSVVRELDQSFSSDIAQNGYFYQFDMTPLLEAVLAYKKALLAHNPNIEIEKAVSILSNPDPNTKLIQPAFQLTSILSELLSVLVR